MTEESKTVLRATKIAAVILSIHELFGVSVEAATDIYYRSETAGLIEEGVGDLHCRSNKYLATIIWDEYLENKSHL